MSKICENCGNQMPPEALFCSNCGSKYEESRVQRQKYCGKCGTEIKDSAQFCHMCGEPIRQYNQGFASVNYQNNTQDLLQKFSHRVKTNAIIWMVIACFQLVMGLLVNWVLLIVGVVNLITSITDLNYSRTVLQNPKGLVLRVKGLVGPIITLVYNLIFGGVIGVAGSIYYLIAVRGFVMENEKAFMSLENS